MKVKARLHPRNSDVKRSGKKKYIIAIRAREKQVSVSGDPVSASEKARVSGGRDLEEEVCVIRWGVLAGGVDAVARRLASSRARDVLGPGESGGHSEGARLGRAPCPSHGPIRARTTAAAAAHAVSASPRHVTQRFLHDAHEPLLPGAPICSSSSRPLLVVSSRTASSRWCTSSKSSSSSSYSFCFSLGLR